MKMNLLRICYLAVTLLVTPFALKAEELGVTYQFVNAQEIGSVEKYEEALKKADFDVYRLKNKRRVLEFDNGLKIELFSAAELGRTDLTKYEDDVKVHPYQKNVLVLAPTGQLYFRMENTNPKYYSK